MKIKLTNKKNSIFNKTLIINKERGENIIIGGGDGSGRSEMLNNLLYELIFQKHIHKSSIYINFIGDTSQYRKIINCLNEFNLIKKNDFFLLNSLSTDAYSQFNKLDFKSSLLQDYFTNKHLILLTHSMEKSSTVLQDTMNNKVYELLDNLPENKGAEIPIIIDNISYFKDHHFKKHMETMQNLNKKGYFFINSTYGMFNIHNFDKNFPLLKDNHKHFLMAHSQINLNNQFMKDIKLKIPLNNIHVGEYYYFKDFVLKNKKPMKFPYKDICFLEKMPELVSQEDILRKLKIQNF